MKALKVHPWPGNVRELKGVILFAALHTDGDTVMKDDISFFQSEPEVPVKLALRNETVEKQQIMTALEKADNNITQAARLLGVSHTTLTYKLRYYGLRKGN